MLGLGQTALTLGIAASAVAAGPLASALCESAPELHHSHGADTRHCRELKIPISISARNGDFALAAPADNIATTNFILNDVQTGMNYTEEVLKGYKTVSGDYMIAATYCKPAEDSNGALQILTHGVGFDRSYWDFPINDYNYSYVDRALARGYSTFAYDRLGLGQSSHGEPVNEIQAELEVSALEFLTRGLKAGEIAGIDDEFHSFFHAGHSFGSIQTYGLTARDPTLSDGIALTGFTMDASAMPSFVYGGNFMVAMTVSASLRSYPAGYLAAGDVSAVQTNFFAPGCFDPEVLEELTRVGQPVTVGELLTLGGPTGTVNNFDGPVIVVTGERDLPFCGGNCNSAETGLVKQVQNFFPEASNFESVQVPGSGHALNLEYTHPTTYSAILDFFDDVVSA